VLNNSSELLGSSREEPRNIGESDNRDLECITEANEASGFNTGINVKATSQNLGLVGYNTNRLSFNFNEPSDHVFGKVGHDLVKLVAVGNSFDYS
jgi:hypothetical protein